MGALSSTSEHYSAIYGDMLAGDENRVKPDRHIVRFIKETCALQKLTDDDVQAIMVRAVEMLKPEYPNITVRFLDSLIWEAQRQ